MTKRGEWDRMARADRRRAACETFAVVGTPEEAIAEVKRRYGDIATRITLQLPAERDERTLAGAVRRAAQPDPMNATDGRSSAGAAGADGADLLPLRPGEVGPELPAFTRVIAHFTEYALLATLWVWALVPQLGRRGLIAAAAIAFVYAISDEFHQSFVEGRDSDPVDFLDRHAAGSRPRSCSVAGQRRRAASRRRPTSR